MEKDLIEIKCENGFNSVSARELHSKLEIETQYTKWFDRMCEYGFEENKDFILVSQKRLTNNSKNPTTTYTEHFISIDMAKEICMIQRTEIGRKFRQYFIECEKRLKEITTPKLSFEEMTKQVLDECNRRIANMSKIIEEQQPKVEFFDAVADSKDAISMNEVAKVLAIKGFGRNNIFEFLREAKILDKNNVPYQKYVDFGYFRVIEQHFQKNSEPCISIKTLVYQKGLDYIRKLILSSSKTNKNEIKNEV